MSDKRFCRAAQSAACSCGGVFWNPVLHLDLPDESLRAVANTIFIQEMARRGIHCNMNFKATLAHTLEDIEFTASCAAEAFALIKSGFESGDLMQLLDSDLTKDRFAG